ncbi:MAG: DUF4390 domain-containing protein [Gammaproteobacteria bacterium]|nr:DUF4390 domain-containing protein [Gammaproteobacteria bacterium]TVQ48702.1 MAG: DUF4390 domain-containing protein [Gammaproteobacteria bacterium]
MTAAPDHWSSGHGALRALRVILCLAIVLALGGAPAQAVEGRFEVRSATLDIVDGVYFLDARVQYRLSADALSALEAGVALTIELQLEVERRRRFLPNQTVAVLNQRYQLQYHALSNRYVLRNLNSGEQESFATLFAALNQLGRVVDLPVIDAALLDPDSRYQFRLRAVLDTREFPGPLRLLAFWADGWRIESDWYRWRLDD